MGIEHRLKTNWQIATSGVMCHVGICRTDTSFIYWINLFILHKI